MHEHPALPALRQTISRLEEGRRHSSCTIPITAAIDRWLPQGGLPTGCIHEIKGSSLASAVAFSAILSARLAGEQGHILYLAPDYSLHPIGLLPYGVKPAQVLHVATKRSQDLAWAAMEALRCSQVSSVMAILDGLDLTASRRLQLAAEASGATGFLLGRATSAPIASPITRWKVSPVIDKSRQGFDEPLWSIDLLYCRGGRPGRWTLEWRGRALNPLPVPSVERTALEALAG